MLSFILAIHAGTAPLASLLESDGFVKVPVEGLLEFELFVTVLLVGLFSLGVPRVLVAVLTLAFFTSAPEIEPPALV